jgi:hypothetical protein
VLPSGYPKQSASSVEVILLLNLENHPLVFFMLSAVQKLLQQFESCHSMFPQLKAQFDDTDSGVARVGRMVQPPWLAEPKGQQSEYFKFKKKEQSFN